MSLDVNISEPDEFNCTELHSCIEEVAKLKGIQDFTYHVDVLCERGENYIANVFRVLIKNTGKENNLSIIIKTLINTTRQELFLELHKREVNAYNEIIAKFIDIQQNIECSNRINLPRCIFSSVDKGREVIILEDLLISKFESDKKFKTFEKLDFLQVNLVICELAKFHALTFVLEKQEDNLDILEKLQSNFTDVMFKDSFLSKSKLRNYFLESFEMSLNLIEDKVLKEKLSPVKLKLFDILRMYSNPRKYNVFCHGDCWINNVLFKSEGNKKELCFLDFQAMRYASPATDILYFLYICTDSEFRSKYFEQLKTAYYESLQEFLKLFNIEASTLYSKEAFLTDIEETLPYGLVMALVELRIVTTSPADEFDLKKVITSETYNENDIGTLRLYQLRVNNVVNESACNGLLDKLLNIM